MDEAGLTDGAVLLMALGEAEAAEVLKHLTPKEVQKLGEAMARLKSVSREQVNAVLERFHSAAAEQTSLGEGDQYVRKVLVQALGEDKARMVLDRILSSSDVSGIESLKWMDAPAVAELIRHEHPQIVASILVHLEREHAAAILGELPERLRGEVVLRIATLESIRPNALRELNEALARLLAGGTDHIRRAALGGPRVAAEILNYVGSKNEAPILEALRGHDADLAQKVEDAMFVFDNLADLDDRAVQLLLREVQSEQLVVALKGASEPLREKILRNMSQRAAEMLREDLEARGPVRLSEVEAQQKEILKIARRLADEGQIVLGGRGEDAYV
ncbi:MAG: flagellar motor switch protein FliG [Burkholderiales bacterium]|nr:flagellar motor switch protein FliG [Burkholderiales bacterium]